MLPYDAGLRGWATGHIGQWTPVVGQVTPILGPRLGYSRGNSAFAAGYLIVLSDRPARRLRLRRLGRIRAAGVDRAAGDRGMASYEALAGPRQARNGANH